MRALHIISVLTLVGSVGFIVVVCLSQDGSGRMPESWIAVGLAGALLAIPGCIYSARKTCEACSAYAGKLVDKVQISARPMHARVDGQPDRRYKYNPWIATHRFTYQCGRCRHLWTREG